MLITKNKKTNNGYELFGSDPKTNAEVPCGKVEKILGGYTIINSKGTQVGFIGDKLNVEAFLPTELN